MGGRTLGRQQARRRPTELQDRDVDILRMLKKAKVLTTGDFIPMIFSSLTVARRRLQKLVGQGYIAAYAEALHEETRYVLDRRGMVELIESGQFEGKARSAPKAFSGPSTHHLMLVRFWSRVIGECHLSEDLVLHGFKFEWEVHAAHLPTVTRFRPDALLVVEDDHREHAYLVEVDTGTESPSVVRAKFDHFTRLHAARMEMYGEVPTGMLVLTSSYRRLTWLAKGGIGGAPIFGKVFDHRAEGGVLSSGWYRLSDIAAGEGAVTGAVVERRGME